MYIYIYTCLYICINIYIYNPRYVYIAYCMHGKLFRY